MANDFRFSRCGKWLLCVCVCVCVCVEVCTEGGGGSMNKRFTFDQVFGPEATQEEAALPSLLATITATLT